MAAFAQTNCAFDQIHAEQLNDPEFREQTEYMDSQYKSNPIMGLLTVPIVFHVLTPSGEALDNFDVPDEQIHSALFALNEDFRNANDLGVDVNIEFCLATRDPNGYPTTGINRVNAGDIENYNEQGMGAGSLGSGGDETQLKALSIW